MKHFYSLITRFSRRPTPRGVSLVELIIVLALSGMLVAGAVAWFGSKKSTDYYDQMRQVESQIREVQNQVASGLVSGYTAGGVCDGDRSAGTTCKLAEGEQILGAGVRMGLTSPRQIDVGFFKVQPATGTVVEFNSRSTTLPVGMRLSAVKVFNRTAGQCSVGDVLSPLPETGADVFDSASARWSLVTFRRNPSVMNTFGSASAYPAVAAADPDSREYLDWGGDSPSSGTTVSSIPCAVLWAFESEERVTIGGVSQARFRGEYVFNLVNQTMRLQTH